ncbi:centrosomal protein of 152 kDa isoform X2 [Denticeps clupeoides]|uniref:centrosomal protein of 152 kDa isoform X2 n=1 Tax=Denticeps clupeoides TaxID=299321 RepID=UPI0010A542C6|nr:centrosomal protein of 152 kDa isoform X2 [Denticeps clupeoides]
MSIDFDSAALQTQHEEEEEYDQEDYAREQELHKLLTDLPDDMLDDSRECSSPEPGYSTCSDRANSNRPQHAWNGPSKWSDQKGPGVTEEDYEDNYNEPSYHEDYSSAQSSNHAAHLQVTTQNLPQRWEAPDGQRYQCEGEGFTYPSMGTEESACTNFSTGDGYEQEVYPVHEDPRPNQNYGNYSNVRNPFQNMDNRTSGDNYKASYNPHQPASQPHMFKPEVPHPNGNYDQLQRDFLDSAQTTVESQQLAQLQILNKAQLRKTEELEQNLEDCKRKIRYLEHQLAIVKDEKDGLAVTLKESGRVLEESKSREAQLQAKVRTLEQQLQAASEREQENVKKQRAAEAAVDSMKLQMMELCRSETLTRAREQHDRDLAAMKEQHETRELNLQQKLDQHTQALQEQMELAQRLREQVRQLERQREAEQVERATVINALTQRLDESQQQCAKLLQTGAVQEMNQMQVKLQQVQSAKNISENMNKVLQEELTELKEHIKLYESGVKLGAITLDNAEWENQLSESYVDLGIKKVNWKNSRLHCSVLTDTGGSNEPKDMAVKELHSELQRCLGSLKDKRQKVIQLQEELRTSQGQLEQVQKQLDVAQKNIRDSMVRESTMEKQLEASSIAPAHQKELVRLQEEKQHLQERVETLEKWNKELKLSEEKVKTANTELCTKMREMIQELDQEKQETAERYERTHQKFRDDVVNRVHSELSQEHQAQVEQLRTHYEQQIQALEAKLSQVSEEILAVQECYISVCKEKDKLDENLKSKSDFEKKMRDEELQRKEESEQAVEKLRADLLSEHQETLTRLQSQWDKEKEAEIKEQICLNLASAKETWQKEQEEVEKAWALRLKEVDGRARAALTGEQASQTLCSTPEPQSISKEELETQLASQKQKLQQEAAVAAGKALEEAVRRTHRELQQKHLDDVAQHVEGAVSRAYSRWLQELTSHPEYKANLQAEKAKWEAQREEHVEKRITSALKESEEKWRESLRVTKEGLEERAVKSKELEKVILTLQEEVGSLTRQLESHREEQATLLTAELAGAKAAWNREKQEEISRLQAQNQREHQVQLEQSLQRMREESSKQKEGELQEWKMRHEHKVQEERCRGQEEALAELKELLGEIPELLRSEGEESKGSSDGHSPAREKSLRFRLRQVCRNMLFKAVLQARQEWKKASEDKLRRVIMETKEHHEQQIRQIQSSAALRKEETCSSKHCAEAIARLQKKCHDQQRHLEKACHRLQQTVQEHKTTLQTLKKEHEETLQKERADHATVLQDVKRSCKDLENQDKLQAGLVEMKGQYTKAVEKIRADMLRYLQESKERAAEMIRVEVLRERQDTARKMRRYYLTCLQELLEEGGQVAGAEKKIISAASKLAAMAKVLETPMSKKKLGRNQNAQGLSSKLDPPKTSVPKQTFPGAPEDPPKGNVNMEGHPSQPRLNSVQKTSTLPPNGLRPTDETGHVDSNKPGGIKASPDPTHTGDHAAMSSVSGCAFSRSNVTHRNQSREQYLLGTDAGETDDCNSPGLQPFLIKELPVRDDNPSDWSLTSTSSNLSNQMQSCFFPTRMIEPVKPFSVRPPSTDFESCLVETSDTTIYKEIRGPVYFEGKQASSINVKKKREPIPGSEGDRLHKLFPKSLFSGLKVAQQDSGFDSPFLGNQK